LWTVHNVKGFTPLDTSGDFRCDINGLWAESVKLIEDFAALPPSIGAIGTATRSDQHCAACATGDSPS
jgi:hypothetical protein